MRGLAWMVALPVCLAACGGGAAPVVLGVDASVAQDAAVVAPPLCENQVRDPDESDVDCGGPCPACRVGQTCRGGSDCTTGRCEGGVCRDAISCSDGQRNGGETDVDCGGPMCAACALGRRCELDIDCLTRTCLAGACAPAPACDDKLHNGKETDVDCGGNCPPCGNGRGCFAAADCTSHLCINNTCSPMPGCDDGLRDNAETDVDCGGGTCPACPNDSECRVDGDCRSQRCDGGRCLNVAIKCFDGQQDQDETDTDCGGTVCAPCPVGGYCLQNRDCTSQMCPMGNGSQCQAAATCGNGKLDGSETDIDCGGPSCRRCAETRKCGKDGDCLTGYCGAGTCQKPTCADKVRNGDESGVDCGGNHCTRCGAGSACNLDSDCFGFTCLGGACVKVPGPQLDFTGPTRVDYAGTMWAPNKVITVDVDVDGFVDLVWLRGSQSNAQIDILFGDGKGGFSAPVTVLAGKDMWDVGVADFAKDGLPDVWAVSQAQSAILVAPGQPQRKFGATITLSVAASPAYAVSGDFNRDGQVDFVVVPYQGGTVRTYLNMGGTKVVAGGTFSFSGAPHAIATADFNADQQLDIAVGDYDDNMGMKVGLGIALSNGAGTFAAPTYVTHPSCATFNELVLADFNRDGKPDLAGSARVGAGADGVCVYLNQGGGQFAAPLVTGGGLGTWRVAAGDVDGDGNPDLITGRFKLMGVLLGAGNGTFKVAGAYAGSTGGLWSFVVADFNRDGKGDVGVGASYDFNEFGSGGLFVNLAVVR